MKIKMHLLLYGPWEEFQVVDGSQNAASNTSVGAWKCLGSKSAIRCLLSHIFLSSFFV